ncbi:hypothetical protein [Pontibacter sp. SGAir0037]|uniref:hypothetical protein n=1 Tax=Pontibacter sp. SGAir0037 TaxID=2571030 RepID=UPI0010CCF017|nr:hypothetical protein [Pontibacter sp. SGAir0037]QCR23770.1 hypothetical protein C1N53_16390 [Pontibacter sp. SGAir0037]
MALTKTYTIEIQMDAAQQKLADAQKKLRELDQELEGLNRDSPAAKAIVAEMAKVAKEIEGITNQTETFSRQLDALKPGSLGALKKEAKDLEASLDGLVVGSQDYEDSLKRLADLKVQINSQPAAEVFKQGSLGAMKEEAEALEKELQQLVKGTQEFKDKTLELGRVKGSIKEIEDAIDALDPKAQAGAYLDFANGMTGAFGIATVAAENFGLASGGSAEAVEKKMLQLMTVMQSFEAIHKALNSETQAAMKNMFSSVSSSIKSILGMGNSWTIAGVKARLFGTTTRAALTATGVGLFIVLLGTLIANWDWVTKKVGEFRNSVAKYLPAVGDFIDGVVAKARDLANVFTFGFIDDAVTAAVKKLEEKERQLTEARISNRKRYIAEEEAAGRSVYVLKQQQLADELKLLEKGSQEYMDKLSEIRVLKASHDRALGEQEAKAAKEAADKRKSEAVKFKQEAEKAAEDVYNLIRQAEADEFSARAEARGRRYEMAKAAGAREQVLLQIQIDAYGEQQQELLDQGKYHSEEWWKLENQKLANLKSIQDLDKQEREKAQSDREKMRQDELDKMDTEYQKQRVILTMRQATVEEFTNLELSHLKVRAIALEKAGKQFTKEYEDIINAIREIEGRLVEKKGGILQRLFDGLFGHLSQEQQDIVKEQLASIVQNALYVADSLLQEAFIRLDTQAEVLDSRLMDLQERNQQINDQLNEAVRRREDLESLLDSSLGAKREHLIQQIAKERLEEKKLIDEKKKAAAEESKIAKQKEEIEQKRQELEAKGRTSQEAGIAISQTAAAFDAVAGAVAAVKSGAGVPFPGNLVAIAAGIASVAAAVASAKKLASTVKAAKFEHGGSPKEVSGLVKGPSHAQGGVPFTVKGVPGYEMEGDEFIVSRSAYANNREAIQRINAIGRSVRFVAIPEHQIKRRANGGESESGAGAASAQVAVVGDSAPLAADELAAIRGLLERIEQHSAITADKDLTLHIGWSEAKQIDDINTQRKQDEQAGKLFG